MNISRGRIPGPAFISHGWPQKIFLPYGWPRKILSGRRSRERSQPKLDCTVPRCSRQKSQPNPICTALQRGRRSRQSPKPALYRIAPHLQTSSRETTHRDYRRTPAALRHLKRINIRLDPFSGLVVELCRICRSEICLTSQSPIGQVSPLPVRFTDRQRPLLIFLSLRHVSLV